MTIIPWRMRNSQPTIRESDPFSNVSRLMDDYFGNFLNLPTIRGLGEIGAEPTDRFMPKINVREADNEIVVTAELPGMAAKDVEVFLDDNVLTLKGERKFEREGSEKDRYYMESSYGSFQRTMTLPFEADKEKIKAQFKDGVLKIDLHRSEKAKDTRRKINIAS